MWEQDVLLPTMLTRPLHVPAVSVYDYKARSTLFLAVLQELASASTSKSPDQGDLVVS